MIFRRLFSGSRPVKHDPHLPDGRRLYAIGDIHGRADLLSKMIQLIVEDLTRSPSPKALTVFLGDYIDRGPDSFGVLELLTAGVLPTDVVTLRGNHELMLLDFLSEATTGLIWRQNGGLETLHSYGLDVTDLRAGQNLVNLANEFRQKLPVAHLAFIHNTTSWYTFGDYFFSHAGVRPGVPLEQQRERDLLWIRAEFLNSKAYHGKVVVHGHTPVMEPQVEDNRINIDTGAYISGRLTCLVLERSKQRFIVAD